MGKAKKKKIPGRDHRSAKKKKRPSKIQAKKRRRMSLVYEPLRKLKPWLKNPRVNDDAAKKLAKLFEEHGFINPIIATSDGIIRAGHTRLKAALKTDLDEIPVIYVEFESEDEAEMFALADNKASEWADWDSEMLYKLFDSRKKLSIDEKSRITGFTQRDIRSLDVRFSGGGLTDPDSIPEIPMKPKCRVGDLWTLGEHRLLCGDSTSAEDVKKLLGGSQPRCVFTDPPYGMQYKGKTFGKDGIPNDSPEESEHVLTSALATFEPKACIYAICYGTSRLDAYFRATSNFVFHRLLTVYKPNRMAYPWRGWILTAEVIGLFSCGKPVWGEGKPKHDVYTFDYSERPPVEVDHPTVKPLSIVSDVVEKIGVGDVYDPFLGSGTTIMACEQLSRRCYGMEIEPKYCDVILDRWAAFTGKDPIRVSDGKSWSSVLRKSAKRLKK